MEKLLTKNGLATISWMITISAFILFACSSLRHFLFQSTALDLAVFDQWVYLASQGLPPISSFFGFHIIGDHAAFILYPIALLYKIYPDVHWLFAVQAIALAFGCLPVYALSLQRGLSVKYARAIAISYLLYPCLFNANFFTDFRPEAIAIPAILWAMWAGIGGRTWQLTVAILLVLICKDSLSLTVVAFGVWLWFTQHQRNYGIACIVAGTAWYLATISYLVPMLRGGQAGGVVFYASMGDSPKEIISNIITNPGLILGRFFLPDTIFYYLLLVLPVIIALHWRQAMTIIPALPMFLLNIISDYSPQRDLVSHYSLTIFPFIIVWLLRSIWQYQKDKKRPWLKPQVLIVWAIISFLVLAKYDFFISRYLSSLSNLNSLHTAVSFVKTQGSVLTTYRIAPHLSQRQTIKLISLDWKPDNTNGEKFDYVLLDFRTKNNNNKLDFNPELGNQLKSNPEFKLTYQQDDVYLFTKN